MKAKFIYLTLSSLLLTGFLYTAHADNLPKGNISVSVNTSSGQVGMGQQGPYGHYPHHFRRIRWVDMMAGYPLPEGAVPGGGEPNNGPLFICRAFYRDGMHPGKIVAGKCNITFGGQEVPMYRYQALVSFAPLNWAPSNGSMIPPNAIPGGYENGRPLFICQAEYHGGMHPGKVVAQMCNIGFAGREIAIPYYNVLVR